jgi:flagellum-specific ATP synthase
MTLLEQAPAPTEREATSRIRGLADKVRHGSYFRSQGRVARVTGLVVESDGPLSAIGDVCRIDSERTGSSTLAEVVGFRGERLLLMPLGQISGIHPGSKVTGTGAPLRVPVGDALKGRVLTGFGEPLDDLGPIVCDHPAPIQFAPPHPMKRQRIRHPFTTGIKALDTFTPCGRGQRLGIFAGSGVGKSTLLGMIASQAEADVNVIALIGERGREVREFLEKDLSPAGRKKTVTIVATANEPALARLNAAFAALTIAEHFRDQGATVMLMMDSVTRFAMAQREIGLSIGEPPATRGYPPSVFSLLPRLLERAGNSADGCMTGLFTVLVEGDDMNDPIGDAVRSIVDGHIVLSRELATQNHYPAIDVLNSVSRLSHDLWTPGQTDSIARARDMMALYRKNEDLINIGGYSAGANPELDQAIALHPRMRDFLRQSIGEGRLPEETWGLLDTALGVPTAEAVKAPAPTTDNILGTNDIVAP